MVKLPARGHKPGIQTHVRIIFFCHTEECAHRWRRIMHRKHSESNTGMVNRAYRSLKYCIQLHLDTSLSKSLKRLQHLLPWGGGFVCFMLMGGAEEWVFCCCHSFGLVFCLFLIYEVLYPDDEQKHTLFCASSPSWSRRATQDSHCGEHPSPSTTAINRNNIKQEWQPVIIELKNCRGCFCINEAMHKYRKPK